MNTEKRKPRLLDLFCGGGGAAMGYARAGFEVVGVDINPQPHFPFEFHRGDALAYSLEGFDAIHASPPCQAYSALRKVFATARLRDHPALIDPVRERLQASGLPYVIENVVGAPLLSPVRLCGSSFGLRVRRHRLFECSFSIESLNCKHGKEKSIAVYGDHPQDPGTGSINRARTLREGQEAMGIDWLPWRELTQAIPPAYTQYIGEFLLRACREK